MRFRWLRQLRAKHGVAKIVRQSLAGEEGKKAALQIALAPAKHHRIQSDHHGGVAGLLGALQHAGCDLTVFPPIELEPASGVAHGLSDLFYGARRHRAQSEWDPQRSRAACRGKVGVSMDQFLHTDRAEYHRR